MKRANSIHQTTRVLGLGCLFLLLPFVLRAQNQQETRFELSGQIMTDIGYNLGQLNADYFDVMRPTQLPAYHNQYGSDGNVYYSVRQSYIRVKSFIPTRLGELKLQFAFDLFGMGETAGETTFHLLDAYAELGRLGAGWNWSLFADIEASPTTLDYWGPVGLALCKNAQLRFIALDGANRLAFALEQPGASADEGRYADRIELNDVKPRFKLPDLTAEFRLTRQWGYAELAGALRRIEWIDEGEDNYDLSGKAWGWGFNLSSKLVLGPSDVLQVQAAAGKGIQNLMNDAPTDIGLETNFTDTIHPVKGVALPLYSFTCYLSHRWNKNWSSIIGWSEIHTQNANGQNPDAFKNGRYASTNLLFSPLPNIQTGLELQWGSRRNYSDGWRYSATRLQFSIRYRFTHHSQALFPK